MNSLYPLKFKPLYKEKVWGGQKIRSLFGKDFHPLANCGESWEVSGVEGNHSVVSNGFLQHNQLQELIEVYMGDLVGDQVYARNGLQFPLLIKFLDTNEPLSVQVHPADALAMERHGVSGKTECWYIIDAEEGAEIVTGFKPGVNQDIYLKHLENNTLGDILHREPVGAGDFFYLPSGRVHAIGAGITLCEIQQSSDVTYRIYDWERKAKDGKQRELHTDLALDAIDFDLVTAHKTLYDEVLNGSRQLVSCPYFVTNLLKFDRPLTCDYFYLDSFVIYICLEGSFTLNYSAGSEILKKGDTLLLPAELKQPELIPDAVCKALEVYVPG